MTVHFLYKFVTFFRLKITAIQTFQGLLLGDLLFIMIQVLHTARISIFARSRFAITNERGFASIFLDLQEATVLLLAVVLFLYYRRLFVIGVLAAMFAYIFFDDTFALHEQLGLLLAQGLHLPALGGMRPRDLGEILIFASLGIIFSSLFSIAYLRGAPAGRPIALVCLGLLIALAFCGVGFDALHTALRQEWLAEPLGILEDGGEMIVISSFLYYSLRLLRDAQGQASILS